MKNEKRAGQMVQIAQNTKGGPLDEKILFSKKFLDLDYSRLILSDFASLIPKTYILLDFEPSTPLFASVHGARSVHGVKMGHA